MPEGQSKFLVEVKNKKVVTYSVELALSDKKTAYEWGKKWLEVNKKSLEDHKVVVTEIMG
jgi:bifunctional pyridoxal-dependent enzyme with beta-cystathionase and maltose regulon repressor activities